MKSAVGLTVTPHALATGASTAKRASASAGRRVRESFMISL
jgi:hypothetical protein